MARRLTCGDLVADLTTDAGTVDLREVRWRGTEVIDRLYAAVRDAGWGTVPGEITDLDVVAEPDAVSVAFTSRHPDAHVAWSGEFLLHPAGLTATFDGLVTAETSLNRVGWCVLHPLAQVGASVRAERGGWPVGPPFRFPDLVEPQPLDGQGGVLPAWGPFDHLVIEGGGVRCDLRFTGDLFETEDQRNWTDASLKTYGTPLAEPHPRRFAVGVRLHQQVDCHFTEAAPDPSDDPPPPPAPGGTGPWWTALLTRPTSTADLAAALTVVDGLRVRLGTDGDPDGLLVLAHALGRPVELEVVARPDTDWTPLRSALAPHPAPDRIIVVPDAPTGSPDETTTPALRVAAASGLGVHPARIGGGTVHHFCEAQRHVLDHLPLVSWRFSPTVHAGDERSIRQTPASYPAIVATARHRAPGAELSVGPLVEPHRGPAALPDGWVADALRAWAATGITRLCTLDVADLALRGELTDLGNAVRAARRAG